MLLLVSLQLVACTLQFSEKHYKFILYPVKKGDSLALIAKRFGASSKEIVLLNHLRGGQDLEEGLILKIPFQGQTLSKKEDDLPNPKVPKDFTPDASSAKTVGLSSAKKFIGRLRWPVKAPHVVSEFGKRWGNFHEGIDLGAPEGEEFFAATDGRVVYSGSGLKGYGNLIVVRSEGLMTVYAHNYENKARVGQSVRQGELLGLVGQTGKATGPHLHYEIRVKDKNGKYVAVDPLVFYRD